MDTGSSFFFLTVEEASAGAAIILQMERARQMGSVAG